MVARAPALGRWWWQVLACLPCSGTCVPEAHKTYANHQVRAPCCWPTGILWRHARPTWGFTRNTDAIRAIAPSGGLPQVGVQPTFNNEYEAKFTQVGPEAYGCGAWPYSGCHLGTAFEIHGMATCTAHACSFEATDIVRRTVRKPCFHNHYCQPAPGPQHPHCASTKGNEAQDYCIISFLT